MTRLIAKGTNAFLPFSVKSAGQALVNADALPTIANIQVSGVSTTLTGTSIAQQQDAVPANLTGRYRVIIPTTAIALEAQVEVHIQAVVGGATVTESLQFIVVERTAGMPYIDAT